jgi:hypothetical protein
MEIAWPRLVLLCALILLVNLPFGFWRGGLRKFSLSWFAAVHGAVPLVVLLRLAFGVGFRWQLLPFFVAAYFGGQFLGARLRRRHRAAAADAGL